MFHCCSYAYKLRGPYIDQSFLLTGGRRKDIIPLAGNLVCHKNRFDNNLRYLPTYVRITALAHAYVHTVKPCMRCMACDYVCTYVRPTFRASMVTFVLSDRLYHIYTVSATYNALRLSGVTVQCMRLPYIYHSNYIPYVHRCVRSFRMFGARIIDASIL